ncbi:hypothetical protein WN944_019041 [Citrus x changshan-huyou]|uniref:Uncharacterized protein n=1 Tax=Citrus x changshan-huyou TaxID=2935761 RepID=A0AAP0LUH8_9ROSI
MVLSLLPRGIVMVLWCSLGSCGIVMVLIRLMWKYDGNRRIPHVELLWCSAWDYAVVALQGARGLAPNLKFGN